MCNDSSKIDPGTCGCGVADIDTDGDGTADCNDACSTDSDKIVRESVDVEFQMLIQMVMAQ